MPLEWRHELYGYAAFSIQNYPNTDLSLSSDDIKLVLRNSQLVRSIMLQYNELQRSVVLIHHVKPEKLDVPPISYKAIISHASTNNSLIEFTMRSPTNALTAPLVTNYIEAIDFPELPVYRPQL